VYVNSVAKRSDGQSNRIFNIPRASAYSANGIALFYNSAQGGWVLYSEDNSGVSTSSTGVPASATPDGWHHFAAKWSTAEAKLFIDGVLKATITNPKLPTAFWGVMDIGSKNGSLVFLNTYFDDVRLSTSYRSDAEILAHASSTSPATTDANDVALVHFDDTLTSDYPSSATITTKTIDLTDVPTSAPTAWLGWTTAGAATSVSLVSTRSSSDGVTWSSWTAPTTNVDGSYTLTSPLNRYLQMQVSLSTSDSTKTPTVRLIIVKANKTTAAINANWTWSFGGRWS
jgi:hypothetical protein